MKPSLHSPRFFTAKINENGRIVIPAAIRDQMGLNPGEAVVMEIDSDGILRIQSHRTHIRALQQEFSQSSAPSQKSAAQQLKEDREEEVPLQMEQWLG
jgi:AbrB family looped-hinge helix DNA binding protein